MDLPALLIEMMFGYDTYTTAAELSLSAVTDPATTITCCPRPTVVTC
ncbi:LxmA leader domain family RiPP [Spongiactinospora rosea]